MMDLRASNALRTGREPLADEAAEFRDSLHVVALGDVHDHPRRRVTVLMPLRSCSAVSMKDMFITPRT